MTFDLKLGLNVSRPKSSSDWHPHLPSYVGEPINTKPNISDIVAQYNAEDLNSLRNQLTTSKIYQLISPKSGSHHHKNIYPQITKAKSI